LAKKRKQLDGRQEVMLGFAEAAAERGQHFFYVLIHEPLGPMDRVERYEDPLTDALGELGEVTGGGSQLGEGGTIAFCGLDVVVNHRERGLMVIRDAYEHAARRRTRSLRSTCRSSPNCTCRPA
jgi:hypothetical protein